MEGNLTLDAIRHIKRFDGTLFQNWKHSMEIMFEFKDIKEIVEVSPTTTKSKDKFCQSQTQPFLLLSHRENYVLNQPTK